MKKILFSLMFVFLFGITSMVYIGTAMAHERLEYGLDGYMHYQEMHDYMVDQEINQQKHRWFMPCY